MQAETKHVWLDLCAEAAICEDPTRLEQLGNQIADVLQQEQQRLAARTFPGAASVQSKIREHGAA